MVVATAICGVGITLYCKCKGIIGKYGLYNLQRGLSKKMGVLGNWEFLGFLGFWSHQVIYFDNLGFALGWGVGKMTKTKSSYLFSVACSINIYIFYNILFTIKDNLITWF